MSAFLTWLCFCVTSMPAIFAINLNSTECKARPVVLPTDPEFNYYPYYVTLHRCSGGIHGFSPAHYKCVVTKQDVIDIDVIVVGEWSKSDGQLTRLIRDVNHTACGKGCVARPEDCARWQRFDNEKCTCICPYSFAPYKCGPSKRWNPVTCSCDCKDPVRNCQLERPTRVWSSNACGCVCDESNMAICASKGLAWDPFACQCNVEAYSTDEPTVDLQGKETTQRYFSDFIGSRQFWYCVVVSEFVLMCVIFDLILYKKKSGFLYRLGNSCRSKKYNVNGSTHNLTHGMEEVD